ncbi:MAG: T9SS type A sorting domain-containing protein [Bacteroidota bacterium]
MKKWITIPTGLFIGLSVMGQTYLTHQNGFKSAFLPFESPVVSAIDVHENHIFISDGDTIRMMDMNSGTLLKKFEKPEDDTVSAYASFLTISSDGSSIWAGYTSDFNVEDRIYQIDTESGVWNLKTVFPQNFDLVFWNDTILVSGINTSSWEDPNGIFLLDTSGQNMHRMLMETGGYSAGLAIDKTGAVYYGTSYMMNPNGLYRWDSARVAGVLNREGPDTLHIADAEKLSDLPAGAYDCDVDVAGNLVLNMNQFGGRKVVVQWNGTTGEGIHLDTLAFTGGEWDWMALIKTVGDISAPEPGNSILTFSFGQPLVDIHAADYPPYVASPIEDISCPYHELQEIDISSVFSDPDDPDSLITKKLLSLSNNYLFGVSVNGNLISFAMPTGKGSVESTETDVVIEGESAGITATDTFRVTIEVVGGVEDHDQTTTEVYPNPTNGIFRIKGEIFEPFDIRIYTLTGVLVREFPERLPEQVVDISGLPDGIYLLSVVWNGMNRSILIHKQ